jgi:hypothetical protein
LSFERIHCFELLCLNLTSLGGGSQVTFDLP